MSTKPRSGETVDVSYHSTQGGSRQSLSGEVVSTTPLPNGYKAVVDGFDGLRYRIEAKDGAAIIKAANRDNNYNRIGFAVIDDE